MALIGGAAEGSLTRTKNLPFSLWPGGGTIDAKKSVAVKNSILLRRIFNTHGKDPLDACWKERSRFGTEKNGTQLQSRVKVRSKKSFSRRKGGDGTAADRE